MPFRLGTVKLDKSAGPIRRALQYAFYDWASKMTRSKRIITYVGFALQGYAFYFTLMWASMLPKWLYSYFLVLPRGPVSYVLVVLLFYTGRWIQNGPLTSEFVRKSQLETDQIAARQIQQTLQPGKLEELPGYELEAFYKPLREVAPCVAPKSLNAVRPIGRTLACMVTSSGASSKRKWTESYLGKNCFGRK